jgi:hypothetical protein
MSTLKLVLVLGMLAFAVYVGALVIPPYFANYEFQDTLDTEARMGTYSTKGDDVIRDAVFRRAQELELPLSAEDIKLQRVGPTGNASVTIEVDYTVHVDLPGYPLDLHFHPTSKNKGVF